MAKRKTNQPLCDLCGLFVEWYPELTGGSSRFIPDTHFTIEKVERRCSKCTNKFGNINSEKVNYDFGIIYI